MENTKEQISSLLHQYWYILIVCIGVLLILGAIFKWKWVMETQGGRALGFLSWVEYLFGEIGYRIAIALIGGVLIVFTIFYTLLLR